MGYEPKLDTTQQTQLSQLSAVASNKIREIAEICNAQLIADKVSTHTVGTCYTQFKSLQNKGWVQIHVISIKH